MPRIPIEIPLGFYKDKVAPLSSQRCINWIPTISEGGALNNKSLKQPSGITEVVQTGLGACRGAWTAKGVPYFVCGNSLISISPTGAVTNYGTITGSVRVMMANNNPDDPSVSPSLVVLVPGGDAFVLLVDTGVLTQITDPDFQTSDSVSFYRGFFVFTTTNGQQLFVSNLNQPLVFDAGDAGASEGNPDRIVTQIVSNDELSIINSQTTEVFRNIGGADFPLQIIPGAYTEKGAHSKYGVGKFDGTYLFIGGGENELTAIWRQASSSQATKISTDAIDNEIQKFNEEEIAASFMMTYAKDGQLLALFTFNSNRIPGKTFVYNGTASVLSGGPVWFEMQTDVSNDGPWRANAIIKANNRLYVGDSIDGRIGELVDDVYTQYGDNILRSATLKPASQNGTTIFAGELEATFQAGVGLTVGQGSDPVVMMEFSDDGSMIFKGPFKRSLGKIGDYGHESIWNRQGRIPDSRTIRFSITDPVNANLIRIAATPELGTQ